MNIYFNLQLLESDLGVQLYNMVNPVYSLSQENIEDEHLAVIMLIKSS
jgi:hypothetical protein